VAGISRLSRIELSVARRSQAVLAVGLLLLLAGALRLVRPSCALGLPPAPMDESAILQEFRSDIAVQEKGPEWVEARGLSLDASFVPAHTPSAGFVFGMLWADLSSMEPTGGWLGVVRRDAVPLTAIEVRRRDCQGGWHVQVYEDLTPAVVELRSDEHVLWYAGRWFLLRGQRVSPLPPRVDATGAFAETTAEGFRAWLWEAGQLDDPRAWAAMVFFWGPIFLLIGFAVWIAESPARLVVIAAWLVAVRWVWRLRRRAGSHASVTAP
jgi:hypothetical protein